MRGVDYLGQCNFHTQCNPGHCSPWGFTHDESPEINGKRLLIVGLNANDPDRTFGKLTRQEYSDFLKGLIRDEVLRQKYKCLSNLIPPITKFLCNSVYDDVGNQFYALAHTNWCNVISCCPLNTSGSKPTKVMKDNCANRIRQNIGSTHELISRVRRIKPTNILIVGSEAQEIWNKCNRFGTEFNSILAALGPKPSISFSKHPSQRTITRYNYWEEVYSALAIGNRSG